MATPGKFEMMDLGGGLNEGMHPSAIKDSEFAELYNWLPDAGKIIRRGGVYNVVRNPLSSSLNSVFIFTGTNGLTYVILGGDDGLFKVNADRDIQVIQSTSAFQAGTTGKPWHMVQINGIGYAVREGVGVRRFSNDFHSPAGINPPGWVPALAQGAAGAIGAGDYIGVATYRNSRTGAESNPGSASNALSLAASKRIDWSNLQPSTDAQVDQLRLWRTIADNTDEYFLVDTIPHTDASYTDNKTTDQLGSLVSNNNGLPPDGSIIGCLWDDCLVLSDGTDVFVSEILLPESFSDTVLNAYRDDGHKIAGVIGWGRRLMVAKTNKIHYFTRTGPRTFERGTMSERHGCYSQKSMKVIGDQLYWYGGDNIYRSSGYGAEPIADTQIRNTLDRVLPTDYQNAVAGVIPALSLYLLSITVDGADHPNLVIAYNYKNGAFSLFDHTSGKVPTDYSELAVGEGESQESLKVGSIYSTFGDRRAYLYMDLAPFDNDVTEDAYTDAAGDLQSATISARFKTKAFGRERGGLLKTLRRVWLLSNQVGTSAEWDLRRQEIQLSAYLDDSATAYKTRTLDLRDSPDWHLLGLNTSRRAASLIQVRGVYADHPAIEISQLALDVMEFERVRRVA